MGVKYRCDYKDNFDNQCRIDIATTEYVDDPILIRGVSPSVCTLIRECSDDPYETIIPTKAEINVYQDEVGSIDIMELMLSLDRQFTVTLYVSGNVEFSGFLVADGMQQDFQSAPFELSLNAVDGLMLLDTIPYTHDNLTGGRCILNYLRQILFADTNLGLPLPIEWACTLKNQQFILEDDIFMGSVRWSQRGEGFTNWNSANPNPSDPDFDATAVVKSCMYILEGMLKSLQCRIKQSRGKWVIWRINDVVSGSFNIIQTPATLSGFDFTYLGIVDKNRTIAQYKTASDYSFVQEDSILTVNPALKTVITTYDHNQRENILPNGSMDNVDSTLNIPIYWGIRSGGLATIETAPSLSDERGSSVKITNGAGDPESTFELINQWLPVDTDVLYASMQLGFKFSIITGPNLYGPGDPKEDQINWETSGGLEFIVIYDNGDPDLLYLNEFGFWVTDVETIAITVDNLKLNDVAQIDFSKRQGIKTVSLPIPAVSPIGQTNEPKFYIGFFIKPNYILQFDDIYINVEDNNDVYSASVSGTTNTGKEEYTLEISSSHSGFQVSNFMTDYSESGEEKFFYDAHLTDATLTEMNSHAILRNRYKPSIIFEGSIYGGAYAYDEIYSVQGLPDKKFLPLRSSWNSETNIATLNMVEIRDDGTGISIKHYGSNDKTQQSN